LGKLTLPILTSTNVVSDLSRAFPKGEFVNLFRQDWLTVMAREVRANREFSARTTDTARWAREQIKRQIGESPKHFASPFRAWPVFGA
jgi:importin subunit beta-1